MAEYTLYHGDCLEVMERSGFWPAERVVLVTDPPYGIGVSTNYKSRGRGALAKCNDFTPIIGDDRPFDPTPFLVFPVAVMFGANHYCGGLVGGSWHVWDKTDGLQSQREVGFNDNSDCEFIWVNKPGASRIFRHRWMGAMKASEQGQRRVHPTQKPVALMLRLIDAYTLPGDTVLDPFMGSGTTGVACAELDRNFIGIEKDATYYEIARSRIETAYSQGRLF